jgi:hypothetical protein
VTRTLPQYHHNLIHKHKLLHPIICEATGTCVKQASLATSSRREHVSKEQGHNGMH